MGILQNAIAGLMTAFDVYKTSDRILAEHQMQQTLVEETARLLEMQNNLKAYNGLFQDPLLHDPADTMDTVRVNKVRPIIDIGVSYLFGKPITLEIPKDEDGEDTPKDSPAEAWLKECHREMNWQSFLLKSAKNGGIFGTPYAKFVPPNEEKGEIYPKLQVLDPSCMTIQWEPRDMDHTTGYIWQYTTYRLDEKKQPKPIVVRQRSVENDDGTWTIIDEWADITENTFDTTVVKWQEDSRTEWPYHWSPVLHCQNLLSANEVYGDPDIDASVLEANDRINFLFSNWVRILKHHAHPKIYLQGNRGAAAELVKLGPKAIWDIPDPQAKVGQLVPGIDGSQHSTAIDEIEEEIQERTQTPAVALGVLPQGRDVDLSGVALRMKMEPLTRKTEEKRLTYGAWIVELCRRLLEMGGFGDDMRVKLIWPEMLPIDPVADHQVALMRQQLRMPDNLIFDDLGVDYEVAHEQWIAEQKELQDLGLATTGGAKGPNGQGPASQMTPAGSQVQGAGASKNDTGPSMQKQQMGGTMKGMPANNSRS